MIMMIKLELKWLLTELVSIVFTQLEGEKKASNSLCIYIFLNNTRK